MTTESTPHKDHSTEMHPTWTSYPATSLIPDQVEASFKKFMREFMIDSDLNPQGYVNALGIVQDIPKDANNGS